VLHVSDFPAAANAGPAVALKPLTLDAEYASVHCNAAGSLPGVDDKVRSNATVPPAGAVALDSNSVVWPNDKPCKQTASVKTRDHFGHVMDCS